MPLLLGLTVFFDFCKSNGNQAKKEILLPLLLPQNDYLCQKVIIGMASLKYFLKHPDAKTESLINLVFQYGYFEIDQKTGRKKYKFLKMSTGEKISPKFWNQAKCRARETMSFPQNSEFNSRLENLETTVYNVYRRLVSNSGLPSPSLLKQEILKDIHLKRGHVVGVDKDKLGFFDFIENVIEERKNGMQLTPTGKQFSIHTIKGYITTLNHLIEFQKYRGERIDFDSIDMNFYNSLVKWFNSQNKAKNTIGKDIKNLKVFISEAFDRELTKNLVFRRKKFKVLREETDAIYLTNEELEQMLALDLSKKPALDLVRDNFLLDCYIGLRIADYNNLKKNHIIERQGIKMISIRMQKTENPVIIPLRKNALKILEKYDYEIKSYTDQTINRRIKEVGKMVGIDEDITSSITRGGVRVTNTKKKFEMISNHTARRSFATNLYLAGVPTLAIMKMTGHKTEKSFLKYIRVTSEENAINIARHPYFAT